jgi:hypothetical protein
LHLHLLYLVVFQLKQFKKFTMAKAYFPDPVYHTDRDFIGYGEESLNPGWPNNGRIAVSFVISYEDVCIYPYQYSPLSLIAFRFRDASALLCTATACPRANLTENPSRPGRVDERNLNVESEYEYGSRMRFWRMFKLFNAFKMKFTLYAVGQVVEETQKLSKEVPRRDTV